MTVTVTFPFVWDLAEQRNQAPDFSTTVPSNVSLIYPLADIHQTLRHATDQEDIVVMPLGL